jgi:hypothetical protein
VEETGGDHWRIVIPRTDLISLRDMPAGIDQYWTIGVVGAALLHRRSPRDASGMGAHERQSRWPRSVAFARLRRVQTFERLSIVAIIAIATRV